MRTSVHRITRLADEFSKKTANHVAALAVYLMYDNFARIHESLRGTPALAAGVTNRLCYVRDIVAPWIVNSVSFNNPHCPPYYLRMWLAGR